MIQRWSTQSRKPMGVMMFSGSLDFFDHSLCPTCARGVSPIAYPTLQFPSSSDCFVHIVSQGSQATSIDDIVFHNHCLLPCNILPILPHNLSRCARTDSDGW